MLCVTALLVAGQAIIWGPLWWHYRVAPEPAIASVVNVHRHQPEDRVLDLVADMSMTTDHPLRGEAAVDAARRLLAGELVLPALPAVPIDVDFSPHDLTQGVPVQNVFTASLIVSDLMLRAYEHHPDPAFVAGALRYALGFIQYERDVQFPRLYERNSHAVANRASVLARLWRHVRTTPLANDITAGLVHLHARRLAALLSKPSTFIAATNHGVMQNIALLQLAVAFPALPEAAAMRELAVQRLAMQWPGYLAIDGATLEHSAGYHFHGVVLSGYAMRLLQLLGQPVPLEWEADHTRALALLAEMQRPDASLPQFGNTYRYAWALPPALGIDTAAWQRALVERERFTRLLPVSGHALWWDRGSDGLPATHTTIPWGYFPGHGHRRAQEMSLLLWSAGNDWSTNTGYWPGSDPTGALAAEGWSGGNGPHIVGETAEQSRRTTLRFHAEGNGLRFIDLERVPTTAAGSSPRVRRQVLQWQGYQWFVLDSFEDPNGRPLRVLWTAAPETTQRQVADRSFVVERAGSPVFMQISFEGAPGIRAAALRGSRQPFGGWVAFDRRAVPAPAVDVYVPSGWVMTSIALQSFSPSGTPPLMKLGDKTSSVRFDSSEHWALHLPNGIEIGRRGAALYWQGEGPGPPKPSTLPLTAGPDVSAALAEIERSRAALLDVYPRFRLMEDSRRRRAWALTGLWAMLCAAAVFVPRWLPNAPFLR